MRSIEDMQKMFMDNRGLIGALGGAAAQEAIIRDVQKLGEQDLRTVYGDRPPSTLAGGLMGEIGRQSAFKPFTVTTPTGGATVSGAGDVTLGMTPEQERVRQQLTGFGEQAFGFLSDPAQRETEQSNLIGMLTQSPAARSAREAEIRTALQAAQAPEQERARLGLEQRLASQGRLGVETSMFGGTPEGLALEKAIQEQQAQNALAAMTQARDEQALTSSQTLAGLQEMRGRSQLAGDLGLQALQSSYLPQQQLISSLMPGLEASRLESALRTTGLGLGTGLAESTLEAQLGYNALANALRQQQFQGLFDLLKGEQEAAAQTAPTKKLDLTSMLPGSYVAPDPTQFKTPEDYLKAIGI